MGKQFLIGNMVFVVGIILFNWQPETADAQPPTRRHTANEKGDLDLVPANQKLRFKSEVEITEKGFVREIKVNGIPDHEVGRFPNRGNPNSITQRSQSFRVPIEPKQNDQPTAAGMMNFGVAVNGVPFDPGAAEFYLGDRRSGWQYEALAGAVPLGLDENYAHVQPGGNYHYHGIPTGLLKKLGADEKKHSPLIGWAADGFPIYALYGYEDPKDAKSKIVKLKTSYQIKSGKRPGGGNNPGAKFDGTFIQDYEFEKGSGDLDECNGRFTVTPEFPDGTYAYFLTENWPVVPRYFRGTPDESFSKGSLHDGSHRRGRPPRTRPPRGSDRR